MLRLLKSDLKRVLKDKLFLISCIVCGVYTILNPLLYKAMFDFMEADTEMLQAMGMMPTAKSMLFQAFLPSGDLGLILPILIIIAVCKDFSYGTVRNKIISGYSRTSVFLSLFLTTSIVMCTLMVAQALITFGISLMFFEYADVAFSISELGYLLLSLLFEILTYVTLCAIMSFLCVFMKNAGVSVVMYFVINFVFALIGSVLSIATVLPGMDESSKKLIEVLINTNIFMSTVIGSGTSYTLEQLLYILAPNIIFAALFIFLGITVFKKKDLK